jgi:hypothetical protein
MSLLQAASIISDDNNKSSSSSFTGKSKEEGKTKLSKADIALGLSKKKKYDVRKDPLAIAAVKWNDMRPRPVSLKGLHVSVVLIVVVLIVVLIVVVALIVVIFA